MGVCAFQGSVVAIDEVSTSLEAMSTHETAQLLRKGVELNILISRLGGTLRGSPRRLH